MIPVNLPASTGGDDTLGALPQTATPAPLLFVLGSALLAIALVAFALARRRVSCSVASPHAAALQWGSASPACDALRRCVDAARRVC